MTTVILTNFNLEFYFGTQLFVISGVNYLRSHKKKNDKMIGYRPADVRVMVENPPGDGPVMRHNYRKYVISSETLVDYAHNSRY